MRREGAKGKEGANEPWLSAIPAAFSRACAAAQCACCQRRSGARPHATRPSLSLSLRDSPGPHRRSVAIASACARRHACCKLQPSADGAFTETKRKRSMKMGSQRVLTGLAVEPWLFASSHFTGSARSGLRESEGTPCHCQCPRASAGAWVLALSRGQHEPDKSREELGLGARRSVPASPRARAVCTSPLKRQRGASSGYRD